ncbi:hypothetical protein [Rhodococcus qingshengii]|uniref:hypothetical protein n=1 Tax=Rhodococcus qingshengii TaxID=334542 RepID=UPI001C216B4A|nr:hypothetical protein [Rhodococcus qingshengii]MCW0191172.1 hypothetical protein [Rhodococcus sp. (in: high G+C Gram-positive bacteria)]QXC46713.1 hypothetical protein KSE96_32010 [Rhodococcus qingshengii]
MSDPHVYLRFWQEGWVQGMSDPDGTRLRHPPQPITIRTIAPTPSATERPRSVKED